jgi:predicted RNase H-like HicB family nuclease
MILKVTVYVEPAESVPGDWIGHCPEYDVISQGGSLDEALEMTCEAVKMVVEDDWAAGYDPKDRACPPPDCRTKYLCRVEVTDPRDEELLNRWSGVMKNLVKGPCDGCDDPECDA